MCGTPWFHRSPVAHQHDAFEAHALRGEPLNELVIDVHSHPGPGGNLHWLGGEVDDMLRSMDISGTDYACFSSYEAIGPDFVEGNDLVAAAIRDHPRRVIGFAIPNPRYPQLAMRDLRVRVEDQGFKGIKIHPAVTATRSRVSTTGRSTSSLTTTTCRSSATRGTPQPPCSGWQEHIRTPPSSGRTRSGGTCGPTI